VEEGQYTFKSNIGEEHKGKIIDHVLTRGYPCEATVSQNGRFLIDHIPVIASVGILGVLRKEGRRLGTTQVPNIRPGDGGAMRRLKKEMDKIVAAGLKDWTHDQLVIWTANKAKGIALTRNKKDNPDGWSPLTRLMRLRLKVLWMAYRRLEHGKGFGDCYKLYKETRRNIRAIELTEDELAWLEDNGVCGELPDWLVWVKRLDMLSVIQEIRHLNKLTSSRMRKELRLRHDEWTRKIQDAADEGKIGRMMKKIMGGGQEFSLDVLHIK
jgi:hypothetical protein